MQLVCLRIRETVKSCQKGDIGNTIGVEEPLYVKGHAETTSLIIMMNTHVSIYIVASSSKFVIIMMDPFRALQVPN